MKEIGDGLVDPPSAVRLNDGMESMEEVARQSLFRWLTDLGREWRVGDVVNAWNQFLSRKKSVE